MNYETKKMAIMVLGDRRAQGWTHDELLELREWMRELDDEAGLLDYLKRECQPILERQAMVAALIERVKSECAIARGETK